MNDIAGEPASISRTLWYRVGDDTQNLVASELIGRPEPLIVLGEAGMGKSHLLEELATHADYALCTARQLINRFEPSTLMGQARVLVIDALDEVAASGNGDAVDRVLQQLGRLGYPRFVLSCRVSEWRSATGLQAVREQYDCPPLELHLAPFTSEDAALFLTACLGSEKARQVISHFNQRGLDGLLGNPQTLQLIARVAHTSLPESRSELFAQATDLLRVEHREEKFGQQPSEVAALDGAGAAFAALILTGSEALSMALLPNQGGGDLVISEVERLPGAEVLQKILGTRLFKAYSAKRFSYWHRRIGEYLGAQWLAKQADTARKRRRLLALFGSLGIVPASLRGLHAWLARDAALAPAVIALDPIGFIEYGDVDGLSAQHAHLLVEALVALAAREPYRHDWGSGSTRGLFQAHTMATLKRLIISADSNFGLRLLLLEGVQGQSLVRELIEDLRTLALDVRESYAIRHAAFEALTKGELGLTFWQELISSLCAMGNANANRLSIEILDTLGYGMCSDQAICDLVVANASSEERIVGQFYRMKRSLPVERAPGILDALAIAARNLGKPHHRPGDRSLTDFAFNLAVRRLQAGGVNGHQLWQWMQVFDAAAGYDQELVKTFNALVLANEELRHQVQRSALIERKDDQPVLIQAFRLGRVAHALEPTPEDVIWLLNELDPETQADWRDYVTLVRHKAEHGAEVRQAALRFAVGDPEAEQWLRELPYPPVPDWQRDQERREARHTREREQRRIQAQAALVQHVDAIADGASNWLIEPTLLYLNLSDDARKDFAPPQRVSDWLGDALAASVFSGFDAYLQSPSRLSSEQIADAIAQDQYDDARFIVVAALAERLRTHRGLADVDVDALVAAALVEMDTRIEAFAGIDGLYAAIEGELAARSMIETLFRRLVEPQLIAKRKIVSGLGTLLQQDRFHGLAQQLAPEWLERFADLPVSVQAEMVTKLVRSNAHGALRPLLARGLSLTDPDGLRLWHAVEVLVDFEAGSQRLNDGPLDKELLWTIRDLTGHKRGDKGAIGLSIAQSEWIVARFRSLWPLARRTTGVSSGMRNAWDASDYLIAMLTHLGRDPDEEATQALQRLYVASDDGYVASVQAILSEQRTLRLESIYQAPSLAGVEAIAKDALPAMASDLQAFMMEELDMVQQKVRADDAESWRGFFDDQNDPRAEEWCRDHLLGLLRQGSNGVSLEPETHMAGDKEADITCSLGDMRIPIEVKGQWHRELWTGADSQLDRLYASDWRAEKRGIYLVLWFGADVPTNKAVASAGRGQPKPTSADALAKQLRLTSVAVTEGRVQVFVLDVSR